MSPAPSPPIWAEEEEEVKMTQKKISRMRKRGEEERGKVNGSEEKGKGKQVSSRKLPEKRRIYDLVSEGENEHVQKKKKAAGKKRSDAFYGLNRRFSSPFPFFVRNLNASAVSFSTLRLIRRRRRGFQCLLLLLLLLPQSPFGARGVHTPPYVPIRVCAFLCPSWIEQCYRRK